MKVFITHEYDSVYSIFKTKPKYTNVGQHFYVSEKDDYLDNISIWTFSYIFGVILIGKKEVLEVEMSIKEVGRFSKICKEN